MDYKKICRNCLCNDFVTVWGYQITKLIPAVCSNTILIQHDIDGISKQLSLNIIREPIMFYTESK